MYIKVYAKRILLMDAHTTNSQSPTLGRRIESEIHSVIVGKPEATRAILMALFAGLHVLIEDIPGVGKTTLAKTVAACTGLDFGRIQFTPDLLPGDITGMTVWSPEKQEFIFKAGAIMRQFILADEINRASARTQSSLLEAMQEGAVTVDGHTYPLEQPFFVIATQNPIQFTGTFVLPEGQLDRFGVCIRLGYPTQQEETEVLRRFRTDNPLLHTKAVCGPDDILHARQSVRDTHIDEKIERYITALAAATRENEYVRLGLSPRGTLQLMRASQAVAHLEGRNYVIPEDVDEALGYVVPHKIVVNEQARMEGISSSVIVERICSETPKPDRIASS